VTDLIAASVPTFAAATRRELDAAPDGVVVGTPVAPLEPIVFSAPGRNSYDYRLVVSRTLYDRAVGTEMSRSLAGLAPGARIHVHPLDLDALGVAEGDDVKVISSKASTVLPITANTRVQRGIAWSPFNQAGGAIEDIVDGSAPTTDVRIERV
jgi:NADH-quinone oxidoreductase subunit G